jgi:hypothetical protein
MTACFRILQPGEGVCFHCLEVSGERRRDHPARAGQSSASEVRRFRVAPGDSEASADAGRLLGGDARSLAGVDARGVRNLAARNPIFVDRHHHFAQLDAAMNQESPSAPPVVHGLGGMGKSTLASALRAPRP